MTNNRSFLLCYSNYPSLSNIHYCGAPIQSTEHTQNQFLGLVIIIGIVVDQKSIIIKFHNLYHQSINKSIEKYNQSIIKRRS